MDANPVKAPQPHAETDQLHSAAAHSSEIILTGQGAVRGLAEGRSIVLRDRGEDPKPKVIDPRLANLELQAFNDALEKTVNKLEAIRARTTDADTQEILDAQIMMANDPIVMAAVRRVIKDGVPSTRIGLPVAASDEKVHIDAVSATLLEIGPYAKTLANVDDEYLRARAADLEQVKDYIIDALLPTGTESIPDIKTPFVLVARKLSLIQVAELNPAYVKAIVTSGGTKADHISILVKDLKIPLVTGVNIKDIKNGTTLLVNGTRGRVVIGPGAGSAERETVLNRVHDYFCQPKPLGTEPARTVDGEPINIYIAANAPKELKAISQQSCRSFGLVRTEFQFTDAKSLPTEEQLYTYYAEIMEKANGSPVLFRILDVGSEKALTWRSLLKNYDSAAEPNPALGLRGIRFALAHQEEILVPQLRAFMRAGLMGDASISIPFVTDISEIRAVKSLMQATSHQMAGIPHNSEMRVGAMIETPAAAFNAYQFIRECDFANVGTGDTSQYTLARDRENSRVAFEYYDPAVLRCYKMICEASEELARDIGQPPKPLILCGPGLSELDLLPVYRGLGYRSFCFAHGDAEFGNHVASLLDSKRCAAFVESLLDKKTGPVTAAEVKARIDEFNHSLLPQ